MADDIRFRLELTPLKPPVIHGEDGVSQKAAGAGKASHYVSFPRLEVRGQVNGREVQGTAWMDHEWFTHQLESAQVGWDWFSAQLDDGADVMLFQLRRRDGSIDPYLVRHVHRPAGPRAPSEARRVYAGAARVLDQPEDEGAVSHQVADRDSVARRVDGMRGGAAGARNWWASIAARIIGKAR